MAHTSRLTFSASAARAAAPSLDDDDEEPGEVIESAPPLRVGEEREIVPGLTKKLLRSGRGWETPALGDQVTVHYVGRMRDGSQFESSRDRGESITFKLGSGEVAFGMDQGIATMKKGELALFTFPSSFGNGQAGSFGAPPDTKLQFEVELISWLTVVDICKDNGLVKTILITGDDRQTGDLDEVTVKYQVRLQDGSIVASEDGVEFKVNEGFFCPAFSKIVKTMRRGEKAFIIIQPQYAFGEQGRVGAAGFPEIPPNSVLNVDMHLVSLKPVVDVTGDGKVLKKILKEGEGIHTPNDGVVAHIRYTAMLEDGTVFEKVGFDGETFDFVVDEEQVIAGLDRSVGTMTKGELSQVTVKPEYGFGGSEAKRGNVIVPANSTLIYEVELVDFIKEKEMWELCQAEKIEISEKLKQRGNELYKIGKFQNAIKKYEKAVDYVADDGAFEGDDVKLVKTLKVSCWLNNAACSLKLKNFSGAIRLCSKVLDIDSCNVKGLFRRAQAYIEIADLDLANLDVKKALECDPHNKEVRSLQISLKNLQTESNKRDAKLYANMFERMRNDTSAALKKLKVEKDQLDERDSSNSRPANAENHMGAP